MSEMQEKTMSITGVMLRAEGDDAIVELEIGGVWHQIIRCDMRSSFSHIVEPSGMKRCMETGKPCAS